MLHFSDRSNKLIRTAIPRYSNCASFIWLVALVYDVHDSEDYSPQGWPVNTHFCFAAGLYICAEYLAFAVGLVYLVWALCKHGAEDMAQGWVMVYWMTVTLGLSFRVVTFAVEGDQMCSAKNEIVADVVTVALTVWPLLLYTLLKSGASYTNVNKLWKLERTRLLLFHLKRAFAVTCFSGVFFGVSYYCLDVS